MIDNAIKFLFVFMFYTLGISIIVMGFDEFVNNMIIGNDYETTTGIAVDYTESIDNDTKITYYKYVYEYEVNGKTYTYKERVAEHTMKPAEGRAVTLYYNTDNPERCTNKLEDPTGGIMLWIGIILILVAICTTVSVAGAKKETVLRFIYINIIIGAVTFPLAFNKLWLCFIAIPIGILVFIELTKVGKDDNTLPVIEFEDEEEYPTFFDEEPNSHASSYNRIREIITNIGPWIFVIIDAISATFLLVTGLRIGNDSGRHLCIASIIFYAGALVSFIKAMKRRKK